ncbi:MAG TPA: flagellar filament capping protein FliD [Sphingomonas sp.]|nr:flagellar filament capping protein FliD [Sphingomonas sp.]
MTTTTATSGTTSTTNTTSSSSSTPPNNASLGQSILSGLNAGAGLDTASLITNLTAAQKAGLETPITTKQATNTAQISAAGSLASDLSTFASSLNTLVTGGTLQSQPQSSKTDVMTVSAVSGTPLSNLGSSITVNQLAQSQSVKSAAFSGSQTFNTGTLMLTVGSGTPIEIDVTSGNNTLAGIATAINGSNAGVTAKVITGADGNATLVMTGKTGQAQAFTMSASDTGSGGQSLSSLAVGAAGGMTQTQGAQDASLTVDGVTIARSSNSFNDVIPGVQMTLTGVGSTALSSTPPTAAITQAVNDFVTAYNQLMGEINTATAAATSGGDAGPLRGNPAIRAMKSQLAQLTTTNLNSSGSVRTLAELGVKTAQDGTLSVDSATMQKMLTTYPSDVEAMFMTTQSSSDPSVLITNKPGAALSGVYTVTGITPAVSGNATGSINGVPMSASSWNLTAAQGNGADGLALQILSSASSSATITINQGLGGALQLLTDGLLQAKTGALASLQTSLTTQQKSLADALTKTDAQVTVYHDRLVHQFSTMNTLVSGYKATQSYLTQQINLWTKSTG